MSSFDPQPTAPRPGERCKAYFGGSGNPAAGLGAPCCSANDAKRLLSPEGACREIARPPQALPEWVCSIDCHGPVGDSAETIALLLPPLAPAPKPS